MPILIKQHSHTFVSTFVKMVSTFVKMIHHNGENQYVELLCKYLVNNMNHFLWHDKNNYVMFM